MGTIYMHGEARVAPHMATSSASQIHPCSARDLKPIKQLGKGAFGEVMLMEHRSLGVRIAVKVRSDTVLPSLVVRACV